MRISGCTGNGRLKNVQHAKPKASVDAWMSPEQLSELIGVATTTLSNWRSRKEGPPYYSFGRSIRYSVPDVEEWMGKQQKQTEQHHEHPQNQGRKAGSSVHVPGAKGVRINRIGGYRTKSQAREEHRGTAPAGVDRGQGRTTEAECADISEGVDRIH